MAKRTREDYIEAQAAFIKFTGLKKGSTVRIINTAKSMSLGWGVCWDSCMDSYVNNGKTYTVSSVRDYNTGINVTGWNWPFWCLEVVQPEPVKVRLDSGDYDAVINEDGSIDVGCQKIAFTTLRDIFNKAYSAYNNYAG